MNTNKKIKSAGRFIFISMPLKLFGWNQLTSNHSLIKSLLSDLRSPICPICETGTLTIYQDEKIINPSISNSNIYACTKCSYSLNCSKEELKTLIINERSKKYEKFSNDIHNKEHLSKIVKTHIITSRLFYFISFCILFFAFYLIVTGKPWLIAINYLSITLTVFLYAMKRSYRAWQILTGNLFIKNSFVKWLMNGRWIQ